MIYLSQSLIYCAFKMLRKRSARGAHLGPGVLVCGHACRVVDISDIHCQTNKIGRKQLIYL
jgi:hypothetical protein